MTSASSGLVGREARPDPPRGPSILAVLADNGHRADGIRAHIYPANAEAAGRGPPVRIFDFACWSALGGRAGEAALWGGIATYPFCQRASSRASCGFWGRSGSGCGRSSIGSRDCCCSPSDQSFRPRRAPDEERARQDATSRASDCAATRGGTAICSDRARSSCPGCGELAVASRTIHSEPGWSGSVAPSCRQHSHRGAPTDGSPYPGRPYRRNRHRSGASVCRTRDRRDELGVRRA